MKIKKESEKIEEAIEDLMVKNRKNKEKISSLRDKLKLTLKREREIEEEERQREFALKGIWKTLCFILSPSEALVLFHFDSDIKQKETASLLGVSPERVRQIKMKAIRKMRHPTRLPLLPLFSDKLRTEISGS